MKNKRRYVAKAVSGKGWRIWNTKMERWWGRFFKECPYELLDELNGEKKSKKIVELNKKLERN